MKLLVTGGLGFIGSNFIEHILNERPDVSVLNVDRCDYCARIHNVTASSRYTYVMCDITNIHKLRKLFEDFIPDVVIHFAAQSHVDTSFDNSLQYINDNIIGTWSVLECVKERRPILIHISTDEVYGEVDINQTSNSDTSVLNPTNPYAATKAGAELLVSSYGHSFKIPYVITRGNNVFGPKQYPEKLIPNFITKILKSESCHIHGEGRSRRNFIYVDDVSRAISLILEKVTKSSDHFGKIFNIGTRNEYSVLEIYEKIIREMNTHGSYIHVSDRPHNDKRYCVDTSALSELGWKEEANFNEALKATIKWYQENPNWYN